MRMRLKTFGFEGPYPGGKHLYMIKGAFKMRVPNPHGENISAGLVSEILRQARISNKDWRKIK